MEGPIINKVAESGLVTLDLEDYYPKNEIVIFDLKDHLFMGMIIKEKEFREALKGLDWEIYRDKVIGITCSADAIIPMWANMLVASYLQPVAKEIVFGNKKEVVASILVRNISAINSSEFADKRIVVKGCGEIEIPEAAYVAITQKLLPTAKSIMYGEACSTVPIYKKPK
ncbi:MAG: hypothetical protein C5B52_06575 [Bacteroidetes bacterium]|nr:MAG: hypothetical protein C5B52_06575 [Bacteroidota bacterium]